MDCFQCSSPNPEDALFCNKCGFSLKPAKETLALTPKGHPFRTESLGEGSVIAGRYHILEKLGAGGMGEVYKAQDNRLQRFVALKFLSQWSSQDEESKKRFIQEARAASVLEHPNICVIHEIDEADAGKMYISMAYYPGETLKQKIQREPLPFARSLDFATQIARGLSKSHSLGIIHRDIKPSNVIITPEGVAKILDFGLAKLSSQADETRTSLIQGTFAYMSPEQARGEEVDHRTDVWSLGVVFYEMLTGRVPFEGDSLQATIFRILNTSPVPPTELNGEIPLNAEHIIYKCLRKQREERYQSIAGLLSDLSAVKEAVDAKLLKDAVEEERKRAVRVETEWRQATMMFAGILGYSQEPESLKTEEAAGLMAGCFEKIRAIVVKYGGRIDRISGSGFMALYGIPKTIEDAPKKAINAAIEIRNCIDDFNKNRQSIIPLGIHIGINSGWVVAGSLEAEENSDFSVMGEAVNIAASFKDLAGKGQIYVGPFTYRHTRDEFEYRKLRPVLISDKKEPLPVYELLSVKERVHRAGPGSSRMIHSAMVGRDPELDRLRLHLLKVISGEGSIVNVIGDAGLGKTRLVTELCLSADMNKVRLLKGRALSIGKNFSFHPLIDLMKSWSGILEEDGNEEAAGKLRRVIADVHPEGVDEVFPFIATLMGLKLTGEYANRIQEISGASRENYILKNLKELIREASERIPLVIIIEDLHWADLTSIEFLESLYRLGEKNPIFFINVFRPDYERTSERILKTIKNRYGHFSADIVMKPLSGVETNQLITNLLKTQALPAGVRELIVRRAEGNPFFIEEVARSFIDDEVIELKDGRVKVTDKIESVVIPGTINEVLMARIDKLDENTRSLLKVASVIGRNFFYKILAEVAKSIGEIENKLEYLKEAQLIREQTRMGEIEYLFKHALAQEAVYNSILSTKRRALHLDVARSIEYVFKDKLHEFYGLLALHFSLGEDLDKAEEYLIKAGEEALHSSASSEALHFYQTALKIYTEKHGEKADPERIALLEKNIADAHYNKGHMKEAVRYFDRVLAQWGERRSSGRVAVLLVFVADMISILRHLYLPSKKAKKPPPSRMNEIVDLVHKRATALTTVDNYRMFVDSIGLLRKLNSIDISGVNEAPSMYIRGSALFAYAGVSFRISRRLLEYPKDYIRSGDIRSVIDYQFGVLMYGIFSGNWTPELDYSQTVVDGCLKLGDLWTAMAYLFWSGILQVEQGKFDSAETCVGKLDEMGDLYEHDLAQARRYTVSTRKHLKLRRLDVSLRDAERGISLSGSVGENLNLLNFAGIKANIQILQGDFQAAEQSLREGEEIIRQEKRITPWHISSHALSRFLFDVRRLEEALHEGDRENARLFRKRAKRSRKTALRVSRKYPPNRTETLRLAGVLDWLCGKHKNALKWLARSVETGERLGALTELSRTYFETAKRLLAGEGRIRRADGLNGEAYLEKARTMFQDLGLDQDLRALQDFERAMRETA